MIWVVVPAYQEAGTVGATLAALAAQTDRDLELVVVDNGCTDDTGDVVRAFAAGAPFGVHLVGEPEPGAGTAADTGFRYAIARGAARIARTDADCLPAPGWTAAANAALDGGAELVCGRSVARPDEHPSWAERHLYPAAVRAAAVYGRYRAAHRRPEFRAPYVLCHGHNLAITAALYQRCGGFPRVPLAGPPDDVELLNRARRHTARIARAEDMVVATSLRRLRAWGPRRLLLWHWDRRYRPADVHIRGGS